MVGFRFYRTHSLSALTKYYLKLALSEWGILNSEEIEVTWGVKIWIRINSLVLTYQAWSNWLNKSIFGASPQITKYKRFIIFSSSFFHWSRSWNRPIESERLFDTINISQMPHRRISWSFHLPHSVFNPFERVHPRSGACIWSVRSHEIVPGWRSPCIIHLFHVTLFRGRARSWAEITISARCWKGRPRTLWFCQMVSVSE